MAEESFVLVSLKEDKAKKLAQVIGNETCRKILDYLATKKEVTETQISKDLNLPASTVHYNLQHLYENKLVEVDEFHYSPKGKEVNHYKLSNKFIIIAPKETPKGVLNKLKNLFPVGILALAAGGLLHFGLKLMGATRSVATKTSFLAEDFADGAAPEMIRAAPNAFDEAADVVVVSGGGAGAPMGAIQTINETVNQTVNKTVELVTNETTGEVTQRITERITETVTITTPANVALWFVLGAAFVLALVIIFELARRKK